MKLLYLVQDVPFPPSDGIRLKVYNVIEYMARNHECHVLAFGDPGARERAVDLTSRIPGITVLDVLAVRSGFPLLLSTVRRTTLRLLPPSTARYESRGFARMLREALRHGSYDVVHYDVVNMAQYVHLGTSTASVQSPNDATSLRYLREAEEYRQPVTRMARLVSAGLLARFEQSVYPRFTKIHVVSQIEAEYLVALCKGIDVEVIANAVDRQFLAFEPRTAPEQEGRAPELLFTGSLAIPGIASGLLEFINLSYPGILAAVPNVRFTILGRSADPGLRRRLEGIPGVTVIPWVQDYVQAIASANVVVFPEKGGAGPKHRVLQAMSLGKAVVGSPDAFQGTRVQDGGNCFICRNPSDFVESISHLLIDESLQRRLGQSARRLVLSNHTMDTLGPRWVSLYQGAVAKFRHPGDIKIRT